MEKQRMEEKVMEENKKTNPDSERKQKLVSAILMAFVCILLMGGGTYAWFTMSNTAKVQSLQLNVAAEGNLRISTEDKGAYENWQNVENKVTWYGDGETVKTLYPCTTSDGVTMKKPKYTSESVVGELETINTVTTPADKDVYYLEKTFYLFMDEGGDDTNATYNVCLVQNKSGATDDDTKGTYFEAAKDTDGSAQYCARVSFLLEDTGGNTTVAAVYEPNSEVAAGENVEKADVAYGTFEAFPSKHKQLSSGTFNHVEGAVSPLNDGDSDMLFTIEGDTAKKVIVRVWFEGTDDYCHNDIQLDGILAQLKFVANKTTTTTSN